VGAAIGALAGAGIYYLAPPPFRARATVNVDFHLERAWPQNTDREQFYYLERETRKLQEIAMSDAVLDAVASQADGVSPAQMRAGKLQLSQPGNGGWHFFADDHDSTRAAALASAWALAFVDQVQKQVTASSTSGLEPYIEARAVQTENLAADHALSSGVYMLAGSVALLALGSLGVLFFHFQP
jgi:capsular polysaccharide biosynthesis protein